MVDVFDDFNTALF